MTELVPTQRLAIQGENLDLIGTAQSLQEMLAVLPEEEQIPAAAHGIDAMLGDAHDLYGTRQIYIHSVAAFILKDYMVPCSNDEDYHHGARFGDITMQAQFGRFSFVRSTVFTSLTVQLFNAHIISSLNEHYEGERILSGMHVPVMAVEALFPVVVSPKRRDRNVGTTNVE